MDVYLGESMISTALDLYSKFNRTVYKNVAISIRYLYPLELMLFDLNELFFLYFNNESAEVEEQKGVEFIIDGLHPIFLMECLDNPDGNNLYRKDKLNYENIKSRYIQYFNSKTEEVI